MKHLKAGTATLACIATLFAGVIIQGAMHSAHLAQENTQLATQLARQGVTGFGVPDVANGVVPFDAGQGCTVDLHIYQSGAAVVLDLPYYDGSHRLIGATDTVKDAATALAVRTNLVATLQANPHNGICK